VATEEELAAIGFGSNSIQDKAGSEDPGGEAQRKPGDVDSGMETEEVEESSHASDEDNGELMSDEVDESDGVVKWDPDDDKMG